jgi:hypothetical protein
LRADKSKVCQLGFTALATDVFLGDPQRFADGKALSSYLGLIPEVLAQLPS